MDGYGIIATLIIGALAGWIASMIMNKDASMGAVANIIVGIIGSFIGGWVFSLLGFTTSGGLFNTILVSVVGACILLVIVNAIRGSSNRR